MRPIHQAPLYQVTLHVVSFDLPSATPPIIERASMVRTWKYGKLQPIPNAPAPSLHPASGPPNTNDDTPTVRRLEQLLSHCPNTSHRRDPMSVSAPAPPACPEVAPRSPGPKPKPKPKLKRKRKRRAASPTASVDVTRRHNITYALRIPSKTPSEYEHEQLLRTPLHVYQVEQACLERLKQDLLVAVMADIEQRIMLPALRTTKPTHVAAAPAPANENVHMFVEYACGCLDGEGRSSMPSASRDIATAHIRQVSGYCADHSLTR